MIITSILNRYELGFRLFMDEAEKFEVKPQSFIPKLILPSTN